VAATKSEVDHSKDCIDLNCECVGIGCDIENYSRLEEVLKRRPAFLKRWFTALERKSIEENAEPYSRACAIFCLKEACIKALWQTKKLTPAEIEVCEQAELLVPMESLRLISSLRYHNSFVEATVEAWIVK
jgi:phosphopantetheine--protein transferase-like protein